MVIKRLSISLLTLGGYGAQSVCLSVRPLVWMPDSSFSTNYAHAAIHNMRISGEGSGTELYYVLTRSWTALCCRI